MPKPALYPKTKYKKPKNFRFKEKIMLIFASFLPNITYFPLLCLVLLIFFHFCFKICMILHTSTRLHYIFFVPGYFISVSQRYYTALLGGPRPAPPITRIKHINIFKSKVKINFSFLCKQTAKER